MITGRSAASCRIRPARPGEAATLGALARRAKAYWGYDRAFMAACRAELTYSPDALRRRPFFVLVEPAAGSGGDGNAPVAPPRGFYALGEVSAGRRIELEALFVLPERIGRGYGRRLLRHALGEAARRGALALTVQSDPNAVGFYRAMGALPAGARESDSVPGRMLPLLVLPVPDPPAPAGGNRP